MRARQFATTLRSWLASGWRRSACSCGQIATKAWATGTTSSSSPSALSSSRPALCRLGWWACSWCCTNATASERARNWTAMTRTTGEGWVEVGEGEVGTRGMAIWASLACKCDRLMWNNIGRGRKKRQRGATWSDERSLRPKAPLWTKICLSLFVTDLDIAICSLTYKKVSVYAYVFARVCECVSAREKERQTETAIRMTMPSLQEKQNDLWDYWEQ